MSENVEKIIQKSKWILINNLRKDLEAKFGEYANSLVVYNHLHDHPVVVSALEDAVDVLCALREVQK